MGVATKKFCFARACGRRASKSNAVGNTGYCGILGRFGSALTCHQHLTLMKSVIPGLNHQDLSTTVRSRAFGHETFFVGGSG